MAATGQDPSEIITQKGLSQINNEQEIIIVIDEMLAKNPQAIMVITNAVKIMFSNSWLVKY